VQKKIDGEVASFILDLVRGNSAEKADALHGLVLRLGPKKAKEILSRLARRRQLQSQGAM